MLDLSQNQGAGIDSGANQELLTHVLNGLAVLDIVIGVLQLRSGTVAQNYIRKGGAWGGAIDEDRLPRTVTTEALAASQLFTTRWLKK